MTDRIKIDNLIRSRRRSMALIVNADATLTVRAPLKMPLDDIEKFLHRKSHWVIRKIKQMKSRPQPVLKAFESGEKFLYLGHEYSFELVESFYTKLQFNNTFQLSKVVRFKARELFLVWYKNEARKVFTQRADDYAEKMGLKYRAIKINNAKTRWGSCAVSGNLNFTWRLIMAPLFVIDYVVVHELAHIPIKNHSRFFWEKVNTFMPDYKEAVQWLEFNSPLLNL